jgi:ABC-2 type transport system permease protein
MWLLGLLFFGWLLTGFNMGFEIVANVVLASAASDVSTANAARDDLDGASSREKATSSFRRSFGDAKSALPMNVGATRTGAMLRLLFFLAFVLIASHAATLGAADAAKPEWDVEWLGTLPLPSRAVAWARLSEFAVFQPFALFAFGPILYALLSLRSNVAAAPLALVALIGAAVMAAAIRLAIETSTRGRMRRAKNLQAALAPLTVVAMLALFAAKFSDRTPRWFEILCDFAAPLSTVLATPLFVLDGGDEGLWGFAIHLGAAGLAAFAAVEYAVRRPLREPSRTSAREASPRSTLRRSSERPFSASFARLRGVVGKDVRLLLRDRNFLVQTTLMPLFVFGLQYFIWSDGASAASIDSKGAAAAAFGVGAYLLLFCAQSVLVAEKDGLWMLFLAPIRLSEIVRRKATAWSVFAAVYVAFVAAALALFSGRLDVEGGVRFLVAVFAVVPCAFIAAALGALGANVEARDPTRRLKTWAVYVYFSVASATATALFAPSWWATAAILVYVSLFAAALLQSVDDRLPYALDPSSAPRFRLSLGDGMGAAFAFLALSAFFTALTLKVAPGGIALLVAYVAAGMVVVGATLAFRRDAPDFKTTVGLRAPDDARLSSGGSLAAAAVGGVAAAALGLAYLAALRALPHLREALSFVDPRAVDVSTGDHVALSVLAIMAAPALEEFVFRGLVFRGLERTFSTKTAVVLSAALFAFVHPLASALPVFCLGIVAAIVFKKSGRLYAPILCHAIYNAAVVAAR